MVSLGGAGACGSSFLAGLVGAQKLGSHEGQSNLEDFLAGEGPMQIREQGGNRAPCVALLWLLCGPGPAPGLSVQGQGVCTEPEVGASGSVLLGAEARGRPPSVPAGHQVPPVLPKETWEERPAEPSSLHCVSWDPPGPRRVGAAALVPVLLGEGVAKPPCPASGTAPPPGRQLCRSQF